MSAKCQNRDRTQHSFEFFGDIDYSFLQFSDYHESGMTRTKYLLQDTMSGKCLYQVLKTKVFEANIFMF